MDCDTIRDYLKLGLSSCVLIPLMLVGFIPAILPFILVGITNNWWPALGFFISIPIGFAILFWWMERVVSPAADSLFDKFNI